MVIREMHHNVFVSALGFRSLPRNLAMGVLRSGGMGRKLSPVSKYGTKPRPGRRLPKKSSKTESSVMSPRQPDDLPDIRGSRKDDLPDIRSLAKG